MLIYFNKTPLSQKDLLNLILSENTKYLKNGILETIKLCRASLSFFWQEYFKNGKVYCMNLIFPFQESNKHFGFLHVYLF